MEMKPGYKMTEAGVIPDEWSVVTLEDVTVSGGLVRGPFGGALKKDFFVNKGYKVYEQGNAIYSTVEKGDYFIDSKKYRELSRFGVDAGDFIVSCSGTIGSIFRIPFGAPKGVINQALLKITVDDAVVDPRFFIFVFQSEPFQNRIKENSHGGAMQNLVGMDVFRKTFFQLPTKAEQEAIAEALSDADAWIEALEQLIAKKRQIKQGAMQELLAGRKRLPGFDEAWKTIHLRELLTYERPDKYIVQDTDYFEQGEVPVLTANKSFILGYTNEKFGIYRDLPVIIFDDFTTDSKYADFLFKVKSSAIKLLKPKHEMVDLRFVYYLMQIIKFPLGDHKRYYISEYQNLEVVVPEFQEQQAITSVLDNMDVEITVLEQKLNKIRLIKQGMMQELLTGRIRLI